MTRKFHSKSGTEVLPFLFSLVDEGGRQQN